jgi:translocation and assembly module TamB
VLLHGRIAPPAGTEVVLPMTGPRTAISAAQLTARLDAATDNSWDLALTLDGLTRPDMALHHAEIRADGTLDQGKLTQMAGDLTAAIRGLSFTDTALAQAVGQDVSLSGKFALKGDGALDLSQVTLTGSDYTGALDGQLQGLDSGFQMDGTARIGAADISRFSGLAGRPLGGAITARLEGTGAPLGGHFDFKLDAKADDLSADIAQVDPLITGQTTLSLTATRGADGLDIHDFRLDGTALGARVSGAVRSRGSDLTFQAKLDDVSRVVKEVSGPVTLKGDVTQDSAGTLTGKVRVDALEASFVNLDGSMAKDGAIDLTFLAQLGDASRFVKEINGPVSLQGDVTRDSAGAVAGKIRIDGPEASFADLNGSLATDGTIALTYDALLAQAERFVPEIRGNLTAKGTAGRTGSTWQVDSDATGPAGIEANIAGTWDQDSGLADLAAIGQLQLAAANRFIAPRSVLGVAKFDLTVKGKPDVSALSGTVSTAGTKVALPNVGQTINDINATITLADAQANLSLTGALAAGGTFRISGPVAMQAPYQGTITTDLQQIVLTDNISYTSSANGQLVYAGPLTGNANLSGQIVFGETEINLNTASGSAGAAPIPEITHLGETSTQRSTRSRAGLIKTSSRSSGPVIGLDITLSAPNKVFARGRGLQAELGGTIVVRGTSQQVAPAGQIELIRGNMDLLGRRLKLTKGLVSLQGKLEPYVEFAASTTTSEGSATMEISGPLGSPEIKVYSDPERPSEEALAMLIFGNRFAEMSPIAIAQMAASVAQLSGKGGGGVTDKARKGLGVDTLDVGTDEDGNASVGAGVYVLDNVYTDFSVNTNGDTELNLNLDVSDNFTLKGTVDNAGDTSMGMFFERDY